MSRALNAEETGISFGVQHVGRPLLTPMKFAPCGAICSSASARLLLPSSPIMPIASSRAGSIRYGALKTVPSVSIIIPIVYLLNICLISLRYIMTRVKLPGA